MPKTKTLVKICGLTSEEQALQVAKLGAHAIGIISVNESPIIPIACAPNLATWRACSSDVNPQIFTKVFVLGI